MITYIRTSKGKKNINILIVEDQYILSYDLSQRLKSLGFGVFSMVSSGEEAIEIMNDGEKPDIIMMDINLEGKIDGLEAAKIINNLSDVPIIYMSAYTDPKTKSVMNKTKFFGFLVKPFSDNELKQTLNHVVLNII